MQSQTMQHAAQAMLSTWCLAALMARRVKSFMQTQTLLMKLV